METFREELKNLTKLLDFTVLVFNKTTLILNDKISNLGKEIIDFINSDNLIGLKKKHLIWNEILKNYTNFLTCLNSMIGISQSGNYLRKIIKLLQEEQKDYLKKKIENLQNNLLKFIELTKSGLISIKYFGEHLDYYNKNPQLEINNLNDIHKILSDTLNKVENILYPKIIQKGKEIQEKTGKGEYLKNLNNEVKSFTGGSENNYYELTIGGKDPKIKISGYHIDHFIQDQFTKFQLVKKDKLKNNLPPELEKKYLEQYLELSRMGKTKFISWILMESGSLENYYTIYKLTVSQIIPDLINYYIIQSGKEIQSEFKFFEDNYKIISDYQIGDKQFRLELIPELIGKSGKELILIIKFLLDLINSNDKKKIYQGKKKVFKELNDIHEKSEFKLKMNNLEKELPKIESGKKLFKLRDKTKMEIQTQIQKFDDLLDPDLFKIKIDKIKISIQSKPDLLVLMEYIINLEKKIRPELIKIEEYLDKLSAGLNNVIILIQYLIDPDQKNTCIRIPEFFNNLGLGLLLIGKLQKNRFPDMNISEKILSANQELEKLFEHNLEKLAEPGLD